MLLICAAFGAFAFTAPPSKATKEPVEIGGPFTLTDQHGHLRTDRDFRGSYMLIYFGYSFCPDVCPAALLKMTDALAKLEKQEPLKAQKIVPVFITVDPERDTPQHLKDYAAHFSPRLVALSGDADALRAVAYPYGVFFAKVPVQGGSYLMDHTGFIYLMGPDGRYITHFEDDVGAFELFSELAAKTAISPGH
jgi:protein SCO1/2